MPECRNAEPQYHQRVNNVLELYFVGSGLSKRKQLEAETAPELEPDYRSNGRNGRAGVGVPAIREGMFPKGDVTALASPKRRIGLGFCLRLIFLTPDFGPSTVCVTFDMSGIGLSPA